MSIFVKIFLWFWLAMALVAGALVGSVVLTQSAPQISHWREVAGDVLSLYGQASVETYERGGRPALRRYLRQLERNTGVRAALFSPQERELSGVMLPPGVRVLVAEAMKSGQVELRFIGRTVLAAERVEAPEGAYYVMVGLLPRRLLAPQLSPLDWGLRFLAVMLTGGLLCYGLARYLTAPVQRLRRTARKLAGGDLAARFGTGFAGRKDEFTDLGRDFDVMADRIENLLGSERRLLRDISHELRSPLARLGVALELARGRAGEEASSYLDRIEHESERMNLLIDRLLQLTRMESRQGEAQRRRIDLVELVREIAADADFEARSRNRSVRIVEEEQCFVDGLAEHLRSAVENVVRNALRYTAENTAVEIQVSKRGVEGRPLCVITVRDHGPGVPDDALENIFRPFYRVSDARERITGGSGLGLAIADRAVRMNGGEIRARNAAGGGLEVEIDLPAAK